MQVMLLASTSFLETYVQLSSSFPALRLHFAWKPWKGGRWLIGKRLQSIVPLPLRKWLSARFFFSTIFNATFLFRHYDLAVNLFRQHLVAASTTKLKQKRLRTAAATSIKRALVLSPNSVDCWRVRTRCVLLGLIWRATPSLLHSGLSRGVLFPSHSPPLLDKG